MAENIIFKAIFDAGSSFQDLDALAKRFEKVKAQEVAVREELKEYRKLLRDVAKDPSLRNSSEQYTDLEKKVVGAELSLRELRKTQRNLNKEFDKLATPEESITRLRKETTLMRAELERSRRGIDLTEDEFDKLKSTIEKNQTAILKWDKSLKDGRTNVGRYRESIGNLSVGFGNVAAGVAAAFAINDITGFIGEATEAYDIQAQNEQKLLVALKGREEVQRRLLDQASQLQTDTQGFVTDEQIIEQQAFLATLGATEEQINDIIAASVDLAAGANLSLESSVRNLSKTFSGLSGELGESIPELRNLTEEQLKAGAAVELVAKQFEGQAEAAGTAGLGAIRGYTMAIGDVKEEIGKELLPVQEALTRSQLRFFELLRDGIRIISPWIARLKEAPQFIKENRVTLAALVVALLAFNQAAILAAANTLRQAAAQKALTIATRAQAIAQNLLNAAMKANPIGLAVAAIGLLVAAFDQAIKRSATFRAVIAGIRETGIELFNVLKEAFGSFVEAFNQFSEGNFKAGFKSLGEGLIKSNPVRIAFKEGGRFIDAYARGFEESKVQDRLKAQADKVKEAVPEFEKAGEDLGGGLGKGVVKGLGETDTKVAEDSLKGLKSQLQGLETELQQLSQTDTEGIKMKLEAIASTKDQIALLEGVINRVRLELEKVDDEKLFKIETIETKDLVPGAEEDDATRIGLQIQAETLLQEELQRVRQKFADQALEAADNRNAELEKKERDRVEKLREVSAEVEELTAEFIASGLKNAEEFGKNLLRIAFDFFEKEAAIAVAQAAVKELGLKGLAGIVTGAIIGGIIRGIVRSLRNSILAEHGLRIDQDGTIQNRDHFIYGPSHAAGGVKIGKFVEAEGGEALIVDEFGGRNIINKRSARRFRPVLRSIMGKKFPGKLALLDAINQAGGGRPLIPTLSSHALPTVPRFAMPPVIKMQEGGRLGSQNVVVADNSDVVAAIERLSTKLETLEVGVDALNKAQRKQQLSNRLNRPE